MSGSHSRVGADKYGVRIVNDFFPSNQIAGPFDLVLSFCVLEHLQQPVNLLESIASVMSRSASLVIAVPDCEPYIEAGDISMFWHEHWNYFTRESLQQTLAMAGFDVAITAAANFGGTLYALARKSDRARVASGTRTETEPYAQFIDAAQAAIQRSQKLLQDARRQGISVGFYAPGRAVNMLAASGADLTQCRFFDDNRELWGTYFPGMPIPIENRDDWATNPPALTVIMSRTFGSRIKESLESLAGTHQAQILTWNHLFQVAHDSRPVCT